MDFAYGKVIISMRSSCQGGMVKIENLVADSITTDVLILGSSRARMQYIPDIIEDSLGMSCFNCGYNGMGIIYHYGMVSMIFERYTPKLVIYDVLPVLEIGTRDDNVIFINQLRSFYGRNATIDSIFSDYDSTEPFKMNVNTYRYHGIFLETLSCMREKEYPEKGYLRRDGVMERDVPIDIKYDYSVDSVKLAYVEKLITTVLSKTKLVICASPRYGYAECGNAFDPIINLCEKYNVPFINRYTDKDYIKDHTLYVDATHFNHKGATKWSRELAGELKKLLNSKK